MPPSFGTAGTASRAPDTTGASLTRSLLILAALFLLTLPLVTTRIYASDEVQYFAYLRSLWFDHDVSFENEYRHFYESGVVQYPLFYETFLERTTETGRRLNFATMGSAVLWSPFYGVADVIVRVRRAMGASIEADGYAQPYVSAVAYGSATYGWLALGLSLLIARRVLGTLGAVALPDHLWALLAVLAVWIGTPLFFYMYIAPPMAHACSAFAVALFVLTWLHVRERWSLRGMALLGALAALMAMVREQDLFIVIGPAVDWLWHFGSAARSASPSPRSRREGWREGSSSSGRVGGSRGQLVVNALVGAAAFLVAFTPQLMAYSTLNGYPGPSRVVGRKMNWMAPHALGVLASPQHGLLFWTPLVLLSLVGLLWLALRGRGQGRDHTRDRDDAGAMAARVGICALLIVASQVYVSGSVDSWTVAGAFGQRRFVGMTAIFILGLAALLTSLPSRWPRRAGLAVAALAIWWNLGLMAQFGAGLMDRQRLELRRNAYHTFVTIPRRLPELVHRYVFERRSFFKRPAA